MNAAEATLLDRAGRMYRRLLLLQCLFEQPRDVDDAGWIGTGDRARDVALAAAIREVIDELTEHARVLTSIPFPLSEWRLGDGPDDERWRPLTELERRDVLSMVSGYENLIAWAEGITRRTSIGEGPGSGADGVLAPARRPARELVEAMEYLKLERSRMTRFRQDLAFLEKHRHRD